MGANLKDVAAEMRAAHERTEEQIRKQGEESERYQCHSKRILWTFIAVSWAFTMYLGGPTLVRVLIWATHDWEAIFHSFPNP
ncbi:hypothetical protein IAG25_30660 [Caballeronia sp. EK]|uniref:hypothetical protein n=1 Tax=Caballeronia sp. EK TaxID=2767469 RepID=UPI0016556185|nr:hypothetical protein [Caballeronia sp. EK]MBC8641186.1 hypothetical protein [Caballeronia sp. EK]